MSNRHKIFIANENKHLSLYESGDEDWALDVHAEDRASGIEARVNLGHSMRAKQVVALGIEIIQCANHWGGETGAAISKALEDIQLALMNVK